MKSKYLVISLIILLIALALSACTTTEVEDTDDVTETGVTETDATETDATETDEKEPVTLKVMNWSQEQADLYQAVAADFQKEYPWITVEFEALVQDKFKETIPLMFQSGESPDIFWWVGSTGPLSQAELLDQDWIRPLNPEGAPSDEWKARWAEGSFVEGINQKDGVVYSFPLQDSIVWGHGYMYINNEVFAAANLDPANPPKTWGELADACATIVEQTDSYCLGIPLKGSWELSRTWIPIAGSAMTGGFFDYKNGRYAIDDPQLLKAFNFIQDRFSANEVLPGVNEKTFVRQAFAEGQAAIYFGGAWMPSVWTTGMGYPDLDFSVARMPFPDDGPKGALPTQLADSRIWVSSQTEHPEEAWLLIEYLTRPEGLYASSFVGEGFGTLAFTDNSKWLEDSHMVEIARIAVEEPFRVVEPMPLLACPAVPESKAQSEATQFRQNWEWDTMVEALIDGSDFAPIAAEIAAKQNEIFQATLAEQAAEGLEVTADCFTFPEWEYDQDYDPANYANH